MDRQKFVVSILPVFSLQVNDLTGWEKLPLALEVTLSLHKEEKTKHYHKYSQPQWVTKGAS